MDEGVVGANEAAINLHEIHWLALKRQLLKRIFNEEELYLAVHPIVGHWIERSDPVFGVETAHYFVAALAEDGLERAEDVVETVIN